MHLIAVPKEKRNSSADMAKLHRKYMTMINIRENWKGHLWQGRFGSFPLEEKHLYIAVRYVERNPLRAGLVKKRINIPGRVRGRLARRDRPTFSIS